MDPVAMARLSPSLSPNPRRTWRDKPKSTPTHYFFRDAIDAVGRAMFGDEWTGKECQTTVPEQLPALVGLGLLAGLLGPTEEARQQATWQTPPSSELLFQVHSLLLRECTEYRNRSLGSLASLSTYRGPPAFTKGEWRKAEAIVARQREDAVEALKRLDRVIDEVTASGQCAQLDVYTRDKDGGPYKPLAADMWNTEGHKTRFTRFEINVDDPFNPDPNPDHGHWLFVGRAKLDALCARLKAKKASDGTPVVPVGYMPPYLAHALRMIEELKITDDNQPKLDFLEKHVCETWTGSVPLSERAASAIAMIVRHPDFTASAVGRSGGAPKKPSQKRGSTPR